MIRYLLMNCCVVFWDTIWLFSVTLLWQHYGASLACDCHCHLARWATVIFARIIVIVSIYYWAECYCLSRWAWARKCSRNFNVSITMLKFEIVSSRISTGSENEKKFVAYMLQVRQDSTESNVTDPDPANVERRYTHFLDLYNGLKKDFPALLVNISFPRKVWVILN